MRVVTKVAALILIPNKNILIKFEFKFIFTFAQHIYLQLGSKRVNHYIC